MALTVWLGYLVGRTVAPDRLELRVGLPLLLAFIPQNVFYALNNDVLSPVCFGGLFLCVLQWLRTSTPTLFLGTLTGLAIAATYLTKLSNLPLVVVALVAIIAKLASAIWQKPDGPSRICGAYPLRCNPNWGLDCLDEISVWRSHRISSKNHFAWLDAQAVFRLVAASNFYGAGFLGFLVGPHH
jgi:hypothetical protein